MSFLCASAKEMPKPTKGAIWLALEARENCYLFGRKKGEEVANSLERGEHESSWPKKWPSDIFFGGGFWIYRWMVWKINKITPQKKPNKTWGNAYVAIVFCCHPCPRVGHGQAAPPSAAPCQGITDLMNLGSLLRSAAFFGVQGSRWRRRQTGGTWHWSP